MLNLISFLSVLFLVWPFTNAQAGPVLADSQQSFASACLADEQEPYRMVEICSTALSDAHLTDKERVDLQFQLAEALYDIDENERAAVAYKNVLKQDQEHTGALNGLGWLAHDHENWSLAADYFAKAGAVRVSAQALAGEASARLRLNQITLDEFVTRMDAALVMSPDYAWVLREKAWLLFDNGRAEEAEIAARLSVQKFEDDPYSLYVLGYLLNEREAWEEAYFYLNKAVQTGDAFTAVYSERSLAAFKRGYLKVALNDAARVIEAWPKNSTGYVRRARALEGLGRRAEAISELQARQAVEHNDFQAYWLADLLFNDERYGAAVQVLARTINEGQPDYHDHLFMARLGLETDDMALAQTHIDVALELNPDASYPYYYKSLLSLAKGNLEAAEADMKTAVRNGLPESSIRHFLGQLMKNGNYVKAIKLGVELRQH
ncbi:MAG: tetratricopeptide repeat protein [Pseudomonadota bacterium]